MLSIHFNFFLFKIFDINFFFLLIPYKVRDSVWYNLLNTAYLSKTFDDRVFINRVFIKKK